ncbi:uncharacterized protein JCM6883_000197 [Sporobolomyces salmoneus]|uniref:uncharacterized protein n=1 Tax=Sporobolomyces salmoneus TaxID=183962 RepID=UPI00317F1B27
MSYSQPHSLSSNFQHFIDREREQLPGQISHAEAELEEDIAKLEAKIRQGGARYLDNNPNVKARLEKLENELRALQGRAQAGLNGLLHREGHSSCVVPPNEIHSLKHYGTERRALIYGSAAAQRAGNAHASLATATGSAGRW